MPSPRIRAVLSGTTAQLAAAKPIIQNVLPPPNRVERRTYEWTTTVEGPITTTVYDFELKTRAWGDATWTDFLGTIAAIQATGATGFMHYHQCSHLDAVVVDCRLASGSEYQEASI